MTKSKHQRKRKGKVRRNQLIRKEEKLNLQSSRAHQNLNGSTLAILELEKLLSARPMNHLRSSTSKRLTLEKVNWERLDLEWETSSHSRRWSIRINSALSSLTWSQESLLTLCLKAWWCALQTLTILTLSWSDPQLARKLVKEFSSKECQLQIFLKKNNLSWSQRRRTWRICWLWRSQMMLWKQLTMASRCALLLVSLRSQSLRIAVSLEILLVINIEHKRY